MSCNILRRTEYPRSLLRQSWGKSWQCYAGLISKVDELFWGRRLVHLSLSRSDSRTGLSWSRVRLMLRLGSHCFRQVFALDCFPIGVAARCHVLWFQGPQLTVIKSSAKVWQRMQVYSFQNLDWRRWAELKAIWSKTQAFTILPRTLFGLLSIAKFSQGIDR